LIVPWRCSRSITFFTASAATIFNGIPELWPSPCPGAPSIIGAWYATPGFCDACGISSMSEPSAITGFPWPQVATNAVGIPATPRSMRKPSFSRMPLRYFEVSNSWKPSSPKLKTLSTITCACFCMPSIWPTRSAFIEASLSAAILTCAAANPASAKNRESFRTLVSYETLV
jgi:hypothetical protein